MELPRFRIETSGNRRLVWDNGKIAKNKIQIKRVEIPQDLNLRGVSLDELVEQNRPSTEEVRRKVPENNYDLYILGWHEVTYTSRKDGEVRMIYYVAARR